MTRSLFVALIAIALAGCVRETVSCTVLGPTDPLCQDPDTGIIDGGERADADVADAGVGETGDAD